MILNFRDFGGIAARPGLAIQKGLLFRSGSLNGASPEDFILLEKLGIRTVVDLRTIKEQAGKPDRLGNTLAIKYVHIPIKTSMVNEDGPARLLFSLLSGKIARLDFAELSTNAYREMVTDFKVELAQLLRLAAEPRNLPILIHCTAGKDRTGFTCGLLQALLGASWEVILMDYLKSNDLLQDYRSEMLQGLKIFGIFGATSARFSPVFEARQEYLSAAFATMQDKYGTAREFARTGLGLTDEELFLIEESLVGRADHLMAV